MGRRHAIIVVAVAIVVAAIALTLSIRDIAHGTNGAIARVHPAGYVGREACADCHAEQTARWLGSHHAKAMQPAEDGTVLGRFDGSQLTVQGVTSTFFRRDGRPWVRTEGADGALQDFPIAYTFGVAPLQQYLIGFPQGRLQALPLAWDSRPIEQGGQRWFSLYPDEAVKPGDPLHWTGRNQTWNYMCADCHSTGLRKGYDLAGDSYGTTASDINVACEACHGPGAAHVDWAKSGATGGDARKGLTITLADSRGGWGEADGRGIRKWSGAPRSDREQQLCAACHARRRPLTEDAAPGHPLLDTHVPSLLDETLYQPDGQIQDEVFEYGSFQQSRMHRAGVTCSDCHEPHGLGLRAQGNELCGQCHVAERFDTASHHHHQPGSAAAQCVTCHMPARTYMMVHARRDHSFRVPAPEQAAALGTPDMCARCHADKSPSWLGQAMGKWSSAQGRTAPGFAAALAAGRRGDGHADAALAAAAGNAANSGIARASALSLLAHAPSDTALDAIGQALGDTDPLIRLGAIRGLEPYGPEQRILAIALLRDPARAVRIEAARLLAVIPVGGEAEALKAALEEWEAAEMTAAERPESHLNLGTLWAEQGRLAQAETAFRTALRLDPRFVPAMLNLADFYRSQRRDNDGETLLRQAVAVAPSDADAQYALGLFLIRRGQRSEAVAPLRQATLLRPADSRFAHTYSLVLRAAK